ncbi:MAG: hypothetical protein AAGA50_26125 [Pseudomonadota bacterium]
MTVYRMIRPVNSRQLRAMKIQVIQRAGIKELAAIERNRLPLCHCHMAEAVVPVEVEKPALEKWRDFLSARLECWCHFIEITQNPNCTSEFVELRTTR